MDAEPETPLARREVLVALALAFLVAVWPVRLVLFGTDRVYGALDTASVQLPWSAALGIPPGTIAQNPDLSDQANFFYSFHRWVSRGWRGGDPPLWNPLIYAGAPGIGNAQSGALDPQVLLLVALEALGGLTAFHWGYGFTAWLRYGLALGGAYLLARRLGLARAPAALAGACFGFSGYLVVWLNHPLGHVPPFLPWVLLFLEGVRGPRALLSAAGAATALLLAILGGHAETAFYVGLAGGLWALAILREDPRAGARALGALALGTACGAASLLPLTEYLGLSAAQLVRAAEAETARVDLLHLGWLLAVLGTGAVCARLFAAEARPALRTWLPAGLGLALVAAAAARSFAADGLGVHARLALAPDLLGKPADGRGGYRGELNFIEVASPWVAFAALAFALAALLARSGPLRRRRLVGGLALACFLLSIQLPGLLELYRYVPVVGLGATVRCASVGALVIGLLAGEGLQAAPRASRFAAAIVLAPLALGALAGDRPAPFAPGVPTEPETDEQLGFVLLPAREIDGVDSPFEGWLHSRVGFDLAKVRAERVDAAGNPLPMETEFDVKLDVSREPSDLARRAAPEAVAAAPPDAVWFRTPFLLTSLLPDGHWRFTLTLHRDGERLAARLARASVIARSARRSPATLAFLGLGLLALLALPLARAPGASWLVPVLALAQGLWFEHGVNPSVPAEWVFPPTRTETILGRELGPHRFFADPGVLTANMGLVRGLRHLDGYDAMDPALFNEYRFHSLPDANALLSWNPRGVDLDNPAFRLYGVKLLAMREPFEHAGWELVASPRGDPPAETAETWIYRATDPLPRAFCVPAVCTLDELGDLYRRGVELWDPLALASLEGSDWRPATPFAHADVSVPEWTNHSVRMRAELDGDGLLVLTDQWFPGWTAWVDGEQREVLVADQIFRGVPLSAGSHEIELRYAPRSLRVGTAVSLGTLLVLAGLWLAGALREARPRAGVPEERPGARGAAGSRR